MTYQLGSAPVEKEFIERMKAVAIGIDQYLNAPGVPKEIGFVVLMFKFGETQGGRMNYMSNANRADVINALTEQLAYFKGAPDNQQGKA